MPNFVGYRLHASATLTNSGAAVQSVSAEISGPVTGVTILNGLLAFGDVGANSSVASVNTITIERNPNQSFDLSTLHWIISAPGPETSVTLSDSGQYDAASGDGIYTGTFVPQAAGDYAA